MFAINIPNPLTAAVKDNLDKRLILELFNFGQKKTGRFPKQCVEHI